MSYGDPHPERAHVPTGITSYLAAHTVVEFLGRICDQPRWKAARDARAARRAAAADQSR